MSIMSTISFPNPHSPSHHTSPSTPGSHTHSSHVNFFPSSYDPQSSASSFQVNPLSSHPPRTPRTSMINTSFQKEVHGNGEEHSARPPDEDEDEDVEKLESSTGKRVRKEEVWREMLATSTGRDKALKLIQYSMRVYLIFHTSLRESRLGSNARSGWEHEMFKRLDATMSGLSLTRKCLILFNWLTPLSTITAPQPLPYTSGPKMGSYGSGKPPPTPPLLHTFLHAPPPVLLDLLNALSDDIATFSRLGLIGKRIGEKAAKLADWCWFSGTLVGLVEVGVEQGLVKNLMDDTESRLYASTFAEGGGPATSRSSPEILAAERELERLRRQYYWLQVSRAKLLMDLVFVSYECFKFQRARRPVMGVAGLTSAILSAMKLYDRHRTLLMRAATG